MELTRTVEVGEGGRIELVLPELSRGAVVEVHVISPEDPSRKRPIGALKGKVRILPGFDAPIEEFDPYS